MAKFSVLTSVAVTLRRWAALLSGGLTFEDNFKGYEWEGSIPANTEAQIPHSLAVVPTRFLVVAPNGTTQITLSPTRRATATYLYLKNIDSTNDFSGKILVLP